MESTFRSIAIIFWVVLLFIIVRPTYQYTYSCNSSAACGCSSSSASLTRIVGGESAGTSTWGWAVSISINNTFLCGGSIISSSWVVTAAHCLAGGYLPSQVIVFAGSNQRFSGTSRVGSSITIHPSYNANTKENDIALIQLATSLTISGSISIICIPSVSSATLSAGEWPPIGLYVSYI
jgi:secreted trypsin-like serine protease